MMKILTPTVSPHFSNASERNRKMLCFSVRNSSLNFPFGRREMVMTELLKLEYFETRADAWLHGSRKVVETSRYPFWWSTRSKERIQRGFKPILRKYLRHFHHLLHFSCSGELFLRLSSFQLSWRAAIFYFEVFSHQARVQDKIVLHWFFSFLVSLLRFFLLLLIVIV